MKFPVAYYLLLLYTSVMFSPTIPLVKDAIAHTFAAAYHIATVHAKYGNNHLEKELANTSDAQSKNQGSEKQLELFAVHITTKNTEDICLIKNCKKAYSFFSEAKILPIVLTIIAPPPKTI